jgi:hypothetical protein
MSKKPSKITVQGSAITILTQNEEDYISLSDMCSGFVGGVALIEQWLRGKDTLEFLGAWERMYNPDFNPHEFEGIRNEAGTNRFYMSVKRWAQATNATGIQARAGRYGGTFAHKDIAFEFGTWLSPEFKLYLIKEFQRLKEDEIRRQSLEWNLHRTLSKLNYRIHTDAVRLHLIPPAIDAPKASLVYATEADLLNLALFGQTAKQWREQNPGKDGNLRDYATVEQLLTLANLENLNAFWITQGETREARLARLNQEAIRQMKALLGHPALAQLPGLQPPQPEK